MSCSVSYESVIKVLSKQCQRGTYTRVGNAWQYVPCGTCEICNYNKSRISRLRLASQQPHSKYCYFVTLTYDTQAVPKARIVHDHDDHYHFEIRPRKKYWSFLKDEKGRYIRDENGKRLGKYISGLYLKANYNIPFRASKAYVEDYLQKASLSFYGKYPYLKDHVGIIQQEDVSLYIKRLRYYIDKDYKNERIHYYVVSEYTPGTFRPHFHILFFFDSEELSTNFIKLALKCWQFGRCDISSVFGNALDYTASYTNSFSRLPFILKEDIRIRPRGRFSVRFGSDAFRRYYDAVKQGDYTAFVDGIDVYTNGESFKLHPSRYVEDTLFFRPSRSSDCDSLQLFTLITNAYRELNDAKQKGYSVYKYVKRCLNDIIALNHEPNRRLSYIFEYLNILNLDLYRNFKSTYYDLLFSRLYTLFQRIKILLDEYKIVTETDLNRVWSIVNRSIYYYKYKEYKHNIEALQFVQDSAKDLFDYYLSPRNFIESDLYDTSLAVDARYHAHNKAEAAIKHREVNDVNLKFVQDYDYN